MSELRESFATPSPTCYATQTHCVMICDSIYVSATFESGAMRLTALCFGILHRKRK